MAKTWVDPIKVSSYVDQILFMKSGEKKTLLLVKVKKKTQTKEGRKNWVIQKLIASLVKMVKMREKEADYSKKISALNKSDVKFKWLGYYEQKKESETYFFKYQI